MKRLWLVLAGIAAIALAVPAAAQTSATVVAAKTAGLIGERYDGYIGYVAVPARGLRREVDAVNIRRRAAYSNLAARRGVTPQDVGITAGCVILRRVAVCESYMLGDNRWRRRESGQPAPVPDYCGP
jgi:uncharacterized protein